MLNNFFEIFAIFFFLSYPRPKNDFLICIVQALSPSGSSTKWAAAGSVSSPLFIPLYLIPSSPYLLENTAKFNFISGAWIVFWQMTDCGHPEGESIGQGCARCTVLYEGASWYWTVFTKCFKKKKKGTLGHFYILWYIEKYKAMHLPNLEEKKTPPLAGSLINVSSELFQRNCKHALTPRKKKEARHAIKFRCLS